MPVLLGEAAAADFDDPLGLMTACHRRVERFLAVLQHVAARLPAGHDARERDALAGSVRYFREAAPLHTADEEKSLAPRLFVIAEPEVAAAKIRWAELEGDHRVKEQIFPGLLAAADALLAGSEVDASAFRSAVERLAAIYAPHIAYEDEVLFPLARRMLDAASIAQMGQELAARRGVVWPR